MSTKRRVLTLGEGRVASDGGTNPYSARHDKNSDFVSFWQASPSRKHVQPRPKSSIDLNCEMTPFGFPTDFWRL
jgi:hypothetical protein